MLELSNDIRGERLRFVEAMKEATAINVQSKPSSRPARTNAEAAPLVAPIILEKKPFVTERQRLIQ